MVMRHFLFISVIILLTIKVFSNAKQCLPAKIDGEIQGFILTGHVFIIEKNYSFISCMKKCSYFKKCQSLNFYDDMKCELNFNTSLHRPNHHVQHPGARYIDAVDIPQELTPAECKDINCADECIPTRNDPACMKIEFCRGKPVPHPYASVEIDASEIIPSALYTCNSPYIYAGGNRAIVCDIESKKWPQAEVACVTAACVGDPAAVSNAVYSVSYPDFVKTANFTCTPPAVNLGGSGVVTCDDASGWETPQISCRSDLPAACGTPPGGNIPSTIQYPTNGNQFIATYTCNSRSGNAPVEHCPVAKCTGILQWQSATMSCSDADCHPGGTNYAGKIACTVSGRTCQNWQTNSPHFSLYPLLGNHNYCRVKDSTEPWCYTTDPAVRWENCPVPSC